MTDKEFNRLIRARAKLVEEIRKIDDQLEKEERLFEAMIVMLPEGAE